MSEKSSFHRDAARILREQASHWYQRGKSSKGKFFKEQANYHEVEANRLDDTEALEERLQDVALLFAREAMMKGWDVGWLKSESNDFLGTVYVRHQFMGTLAWTMPLERIPKWIGLYQNIPDEVHVPEMYLRIDRYLRGTEPKLTRVAGGY